MIQCKRVLNLTVMHSFNEQNSFNDQTLDKPCQKLGDVNCKKKST